jgi:hypothetical protein
MLDTSLLGLNTSGWLRESDRSQRERLADTNRSILQACINQLRAVTDGRQELGAC